MRTHTTTNRLREDVTESEKLPEGAAGGGARKIGKVGSKRSNTTGSSHPRKKKNRERSAPPTEAGGDGR